ncbi:27-O-demethylrifamycin SV methyltransferase [Halioglobus japonicus]|nr:27-O-demethylrifamycin SV methyltransferase [Halioglobus japonicus]
MSSEMSKEEIVQLQYRQRFSQATDYRNALWAVLCNDFFQRYIDRQSVVFDLGCGWGEFSNNISASKKYAMDMNPDAAARLNDDVELFSQDCSQPWPLADASLDVVFTSNFLEHLPDKAHVEATVAELKRCLKPGGLLIAIGPNVRLLPGAYWDFWDHHVHISDRSLAELLSMNGFEVTEREAAFLPYTMSDGKQPNLLLVKLYIKFRLFWKLFGKQFLVVARAGA